MASQFIDRIAVELDGAGDAVLMIHGLGGSSNIWTPLMSALARQFKSDGTTMPTPLPERLGATTSTCSGPS